MKIEYLLCIVASAFLHAFYNFLMRRSGGNRVFLFGMFAAASIVSAGVMIFTGDYRFIPWQYVPYVYGASFFYIAYQILVSRAYEQGRISKYYPLTVLSPIFIPMWATLFLGEHISPLAGLGVIVTTAGAVIVKLNSFSLEEFRKMFSFSKEYLGARFALGASVVYSFGAIFDKSKIAFFPLPAYITILLTAMSINTLFYFYFMEKQPVLSYLGKYWKTMVMGGVVVMASFLTFRVALKAVPVSIAVPVRLVAIVFAILLGIFVLKEKFRVSNLIGSLVIIAGIVLVNLGI